MLTQVKKIAILADFPHSALEGAVTGRGGGQGCTWLPQLALGLAKQDEFEIHWISLDRGLKSPVVDRALGQYFHRIPAVRFSIDLATGYWSARRGLRRAIRKIGADLVHAWGTERIYPCALLGLEVPTILSMQGVLTEYARIGSLDPGWRWRAMVRSEPGFIRSATVVTCESQWGIDKVKAIDSGADCRMVEYGVHPSFFELEWQPGQGEPYLLYVGSLGPRKGFDVLLGALERLKERSWECRLAGDAAMHDAVAGRRLGKLRVLGLVDWQELRKQLSGAWAVTLPTRADTSPNSVKEARVVGAPVVASIHGGHTGYLRDGVNGRLIEQLDEVSLADALTDVMASFGRARQLGMGRHGEDREYLDPQRTAESFAELYRELLCGS